jgi:uncharacterized RDD family membrane protein YckC
MATSAPEPSPPTVSRAIAPPSQIEPPGIARRLACFTYEGVLLFGVVMIGGYLFSSLTQQRNAMIGRHGLQAFLFLLLGIYFVWFWSRSGQTVAMKAWHIRLVDMNNRPPSQLRCTARYLLSWIWFAPALLFSWAAHTTPAQTFGLLIAGVLTYAVLARLHPKRQFWHDMLCGTQLVTHHPAPRKKPE